MRYGTFWNVKPGALASTEKADSGHPTAREAYRALGTRPGRVACLPTIESKMAPGAADYVAFEASRWCVVVKT